MRVALIDQSKIVDNWCFIGSGGGYPVFESYGGPDKTSGIEIVGWIAIEYRVIRIILSCETVTKAPSRGVDIVHR